MEIISINQLCDTLIKKYNAKKVSEGKKSIVLTIEDEIILESLFNEEEKQKNVIRFNQIFNVYGCIPCDEEINVGKKIEIEVYLEKIGVIKNFAISPICDYLFNDLIVIIGISEEDDVNQTPKYRRYLAAKKYVKESMLIINFDV